MMGHNEQDEVQHARQLWDAAAATFDDEPDHGLRDPLVRRAWQEFLVHWLPPAPKRVLDIGCGTGSLSLLMAIAGHAVTGIDLSPVMLAQAEAKAQAAGQQIAFQVMNAAHPQLPAHHYDVIVCRHLLWALPQPAQVLARWAELVRPGGRLILVEGFWKTGAGLHSEELMGDLPPTVTNTVLHNLSAHAEFWDGAVADERYAIIADLA